MTNQQYLALKKKVLELEATNHISKYNLSCIILCFFSLASCYAYFHDNAIQHLLAYFIISMIADFQVYLFISAQRVAGCLVAEPLEFAHRILSSCVNDKLISHASKGQQKPATLQFGGIRFQREVISRASSVNENKLSSGNCSGAIFCENETVPVVCGIRAIWVTPSNRRKHIATKLLDAVRYAFIMNSTLNIDICYGHLHQS